MAECLFMWSEGDVFVDIFGSCLTTFGILTKRISGDDSICLQINDLRKGGFC